MKISAINNAMVKITKQHSVNSIQNNVNDQKTNKTNSLPRINYSDILFNGDPTRRQILSKAKWHNEHAARIMQDVSFYDNKTKEAAPQVFQLITEEENKTIDTINDAYKVADEGFKNGFEPFVKDDGTKVEFEKAKEDGKSQQTTMLEYDKDNNLIRETVLDGTSIHYIATYNEDTIDEIKVENSKPIRINKGITNLTPKDENSNDVHKVKFACDFSDPDEKTVYYDVVRRGEDDYSAEKIYRFTPDGKLEFMNFSYTQNPDGSTHSEIEMQYNNTMFQEKSFLDILRKDVHLDKEGNLRAGQDVIMRAGGEFPSRIRENFVRNIDGTRECEHVYSVTPRIHSINHKRFVKGEILPRTRNVTELQPLLTMVKSGEKVTDDGVSADKIYLMNSKGLEYYMQNCSRKKGDRQYWCERKVTF